MIISNAIFSLMRIHGNLKVNLRFVFHRNRSVIKKNKKLENKYTGKRCFILGNGPSLNDNDLSSLKNEYVFCVNEAFRFDKLNQISPNFFVMADGLYFNLDPNDKKNDSFFSGMERIMNENRNMELFFSINCIEPVFKYGWPQKCKTWFFMPGLDFEDIHKIKIDFSRVIPNMQCVVQYAILLAIYMGFSEIYLLGTEQTNIFGNIKAYMSEEISDYAFSLSDSERKWKNNLMIKYSLSETLRGYARIFELYGKLGDYCSQKKIKLVNCSPNSLIQGIPKEEYERVL